MCCIASQIRFRHFSCVCFSPQFRTSIRMNELFMKFEYFIRKRKKLLWDLVRFEEIEIYSIVPLMLQRMFVYNFINMCVLCFFVPFPAAIYVFCIAFHLIPMQHLGFECVQHFYLTLYLNHMVCINREFYVLCFYH